MQNDHKRLRAIGAGLNPAVTIGDKGVTPSLTEEVDGRLRDHELIKVRSQIKDRQQNAAMFTALCEQLNARLVQVTGRTALVLRKATGEAPKRSNIRGGNT